jgi:hypothetical protein
MSRIGRRLQTRTLLLGLLVFCFFFLSYNLGKAHAHGITDPWVHQKIAKYALFLWQDCPVEMRNHGERDVSTFLELPCLISYDPGDDIILGSGEEDHEKNPFCGPPLRCADDNEGRNGFMEHFWNPDEFYGREYNCVGSRAFNKGLVFTFPLDAFQIEYNYDSAYQLAQDLWDNKAIRFYKEGKELIRQGHDAEGQAKIDEAYYWLGRVAHLLTDMCVPAHVHLKPHGPDLPLIENDSSDCFEYYFDKHHPEYINDFLWDLNTPCPLGQEYRVEALPNLSGFNWDEIWFYSGETFTPSNLFKLFWFTAQKTQYFASINANGTNPANGNSQYKPLNGEPRDFNPPLWMGDPAVIISDPELVPGNEDKMADALIPHAMRAVAGLYRLFWIETHAVKWTFGAPGEIVSSPAIGPDGTIYAGGRDKLFALYPNGTQKWEFPMGDEESNVYSPAVGPDGTIYVYYNTILYAIDPKERVKKWEYSAYGGSTPAIGRDGTVYVNFSNCLVAIPPSGPAQGVKTYEHYYYYGGNPVVGPNGTVYVGGTYGLFVVHPDGRTETWSYEGNSGYASPTIDTDGTLYVGTPENLLALYPNGAKKWAEELSGSINHLVIGRDGRIYWVEDDWSNSSHPLYAIGRNKENKQLICHIDGGFSFQAIGADGTIYVYRGFGPALPEYDNFYAIDPQGSIKWGVTFSKHMAGASPPVISPDGAIYVLSAAGPLLAIDSTVGGLFNNCGGLARSPWPMYGANPQQTFRANVNRSLPFIEVLLGN